MTRQTHTYAVLEISPGAYREIREKLEAASYQHAFNGDEIDMHGIGVKADAQPEVRTKHGDRPCAAVLVPIPDHMPEARAEFVADHPEYGVDAGGRHCFRIDACIEPALRAVWAAGYKTLGCCCGHGQEAGGIITIDTGSYSSAPRTETQERYAATHEARDRDLEPLRRALLALAPREYGRAVRAVRALLKGLK